MIELFILLLALASLIDIWDAKNKTNNDREAEKMLKRHKEQ